MSIIMKYHPAKKEVKFIRSQYGTQMPIQPDSILSTYMNKKGKFVLQDHGDAFLADIARTFDAEQIVDIEVITTRRDYEDFEQMVEHFNSTSEVRIDTKLSEELPDMEATCLAVKSHGEKSMGILKKHQAKFFEIDTNNPVVKECVENFAADVNREIDSIKEKIDAIADNNVNLCFAGVYSAGKSSLINALLGYMILPEDEQSLTAKMFRIQSPRPNEKVRIVFTIRNVYTEVTWNDGRNIFEFAAGPTENRSKEAIQETINGNQEKFQHHQIYEILKTLNTDDNISSEIRVFFPVSLDTDKVQFTIYDTPGTDSNYGEHQSVLRDALSEQTHSILVFVLHPVKLEGEGNNALLNYLKEAEGKDSKTSIDIDRSLFVMNFADTLKSPERREKFQKDVIKDKMDDTFSVSLSDKKLFFTAAKTAYAAKAMKNGTQNDDDEFEIRINEKNITDKERGRCYRQNKCATSERSTKRMIELSTLELEKAESDNDTLKVLYVCSGVFALEKEICLYGEKFASAVRAYAIIGSVDKALSKMNANAEALGNQNQRDIRQLEAEIKELKDAISDSVKKARQKHSVPKDAPLPMKILTELQLDGESLSKKFIGEPKSFFEKLLKGWFFRIAGKVKYNETHKREITQKVNSVISDFTKNFLDKRHKLLQEQRDTFIATVKQILENNGKLSDETRSFVLDIRPPEIKQPTSTDVFLEIYEKKRHSENFLFITTEYIDKEGFIQDCEGKLMNIAKSLKEDFEKDYRDGLETALSAVESEYIQNLKKYSVLMKAKVGDKEEMEKLGGKIKDAADELKACKGEFDSLIWSMKNDGQ